MGKLRSRIAAAVVVAGIAGAFAPAASEATVYCVPNLSVDPSCQVADPAVQPMLTAAANSLGVADTVRIGNGTFTVTNSGYTNANDDVQIIGAGTGATKLQLTDTNGTNTAMFFSAPATSVLRDLTIEVGTNMDANADQGLDMSGSAVARNVVVRGPDATNAIAVVLRENALFDDSVVDLEQINPSSNTGVRHLGGDTRVTDSTITADTGVTTVSNSGGAITVARSTVVAVNGLINPGADDPVIGSNVVIDLGAADNSAGVRAENGNESSSPVTVTGDHLTIVGGGDNSFGVRSIGDSNGGPPDPFGGIPDDTTNDGETGNVTLSNSVISGPETSVLVGADRGEFANATLSYVSVDTAPVDDDDSRDDGVGFGTATLNQSNVTTNADPGFVNPAAGNYRLLSSSPLINAGDPAPPAPGETDRDGSPRAVGPGTCAPNPQPQPRRDIGAFEAGLFALPCPPLTPNQPQAQTQPPSTTPKPKCKKPKKKSKASTAAKKCKRKKKRGK